MARLLLLLPLVSVALRQERSERVGVERVGDDEESSGMSKVLCTRRLPYVRNRLCLEVKTHTDDLTKFVTSAHGLAAGMEEELEGNPLLVPDLTLDLAWMGCPTCLAEMRACSPGQPCRQDPKSRLHFPWIRIMPLSLKSLLAGQCLSLSALLVTPTLSSVFLPFLGTLAPYLGGALGYASSRLLDEFLLGRYCLYLTTHVAGEVISGKELKQDSMCIDHLYTIHIPGLFGLVKARKVANPESSLVCWPTAESAEGLVGAMEPMDEEGNGDSEGMDTEGKLEIPQIPHEVLAKDKVCRHGATANFCVACETVVQAASWRLEELRAASTHGLRNAEDELEVVESKMLIHPNTKEQCLGDEDPACLDDYSICVLKPGHANATSCTAETVYSKEHTKPLCSLLCSSSCGAFWSGTRPYCWVGEEHAEKSCLESGEGKHFAVVKPGRLGSHWVPCQQGPVAKFTVQWQHRLLKIVEMRRVGNTTAAQRSNAARQVMQTFSESAPSAALSMLDALLLRLALVAKANLSDAGTLLCREAGCCNEETVRPYFMPL